VIGEVFLVAQLTDIATSLGVLPFAAPLREETPAMMLSASVFALADKALRIGQAVEVVGGMLAGALFFHWTALFPSSRSSWSSSPKARRAARGSILRGA
jgi:hypothetical protein